MGGSPESRRSIVKRISTLFISIVTVVAVMAIASSAPASAMTGYPNVRLIEPQQSAATHEAASPSTPKDVSSLNAIMGASKTSQSTPKDASSLNSITGPSESTPVPTTTVVHEQSGFDWGDAFVGAVGALLLALVSVATVHTLRRRGATLESSF
jgi:hypothetical protein